MAWIEEAILAVLDRMGTTVWLTTKMTQIRKKMNLRVSTVQ